MLSRQAVHAPPPETNEADPLSSSAWQSLARHTDLVLEELHGILTKTGVEQPALPLAGRWHDWGKAHRAFAAKIKRAERESEEGRQHLPIAKAPSAAWLRHNERCDPDERRKHFRHELASTLAN